MSGSAIAVPTFAFALAIALGVAAAPAGADRLVDDTAQFTSWVDQRAVVREGAALHLDVARKGPTHTLEHTAWVNVIQVDRAAGLVRVQDHAGAAQIAWYVAIDSLEPVVIKKTFLTPGPRGAGRRRSRSPGVRLGPAARVTVEEVAGRRDVIHVTHASDGYSVSGYLPRQHVGSMYQPSLLERERPLRATHTVSAATLVLDRPGGRSFARIGAAALDARAIGKARRGHRLVETGALVGWVRSDRLAPLAPGATAAGDAGGGVVGAVVGGKPDGHRGDGVVLPAGARLYSSPDGELVGVLTKGLRRPAPRDRWVEIRLDSQLASDIAVWADTHR